MREVIFKEMMTFLETHPSHLLSKAFARIEIQILLQATAKGFGCKGKWILLTQNPLQEYAEYSNRCMACPNSSCVELKKTQEARKNLYRLSYRLGRRIRKITGFTDPEDLKRLVFLLYRNIGITMSGSLPGEIVVSECYFSRIYSAKQCKYISAMDAGIMIGVVYGIHEDCTDCSNRKFTFTERITEGCEQCKAHLR